MQQFRAAPERFCVGLWAASEAVVEWLSRFVSTVCWPCSACYFLEVIRPPPSWKGSYAKWQPWNMHILCSHQSFVPSPTSFLFPTVPSQNQFFSSPPIMCCCFLLLFHELFYLSIKCLDTFLPITLFDVFTRFSSLGSLPYSVFTLFHKTNQFAIQGLQPCLFVNETN